MQLKQYILGRTTINNQIGTNNAIRHIASENESETIVCNQMGQENKFSSRNKIQRAPKTIVCTQLGETNKIIIELDDQTKSKKVLSIEGKGGMCVFQIVLNLLMGIILFMHSLCQKKNLYQV